MRRRIKPGEVRQAQHLTRNGPESYDREEVAMTTEPTENLHSEVDREAQHDRLNEPPDDDRPSPAELAEGRDHALREALQDVLEWGKGLAGWYVWPPPKDLPPAVQRAFALLHGPHDDEPRS
jgi:hypothetical protein